MHKEPNKVCKNNIKVNYITLDLKRKRHCYRLWSTKFVCLRFGNYQIFEENCCPYLWGIFTLKKLKNSLSSVMLATTFKTSEFNNTERRNFRNIWTLNFETYYIFFFVSNLYCYVTGAESENFQDNPLSPKKIQYLFSSRRIILPPLSELHVKPFQNRSTDNHPRFTDVFMAKF